MGGGQRRAEAKRTLRPCGREAEMVAAVGHRGGTRPEVRARRQLREDVPRSRKMQLRDYRCFLTLRRVRMNYPKSRRSEMPVFPAR